jgi:hypothetical protein
MTEKLSWWEVEDSQPAVVLWNERGEPEDGKASAQRRGNSAGVAEVESGDAVVKICRKHGISRQSFYLWKKKYAGLGLQELRELRQVA